MKNWFIESYDVCPEEVKYYIIKCLTNDFGEHKEYYEDLSQIGIAFTEAESWLSPKDTQWIVDNEYEFCVEWFYQKNKINENG